MDTLRFEVPKQRAVVVVLVDSFGRWCLASKKQPIHTKERVLEGTLGVLNGYGGKENREDGGDLKKTAQRELHEEARISADVRDIKEVFRVYFYVEKNGTVSPFLDVTFFMCDHWAGTPMETEEMGACERFLPSEIPWHRMMPADLKLFSNYIVRSTGALQEESFSPFLAEVILRGKGVAPKVRYLS